MLVLARRRDQVITITVPPSDSVTLIDIMVTDIQRAPVAFMDKVKLGFRAPEWVQILRDDAKEVR